jgi:hypothetical protein
LYLLVWKSRNGKIYIWTYFDGTGEMKMMVICTYWYGKVKLEKFIFVPNGTEY